MVKEDVLLQMKSDITFYVNNLRVSSQERCVYCVVFERTGKSMSNLTRLLKVTPDSSE